jgi:HTH-type transcriptional regulator / antitoxin HigA
MERIKMKVSDQELAYTLRAWPTVSRILSTLHSESQYNKAVKLLDELMDKVSMNNDPLVESLIDTLGTLIKEYEDRTIAEPQGDPIGCLRYLMEEHQLKQNDLSELGSQGVVSEILNGKRQLNIRQIRALSKRFNVSPAVFI